jgi:hypothetical protein
VAINVTFENHLSARVVEIQFPEGIKIATSEDVADLKSAWAENLKKWHSPYTCLFDCRNFQVDEPVRKDFERLVGFFKNFFMKTIIGFANEGALPEWCPFEVVEGYDTAVSRTGLARGAGLTRNLDDLRSRIQIDNDFNAHVMEISFLAETELNSAADIQIMKSKLQNILKMWHSPYSVLFNCSNLQFSTEATQEFIRLEKFLKSFFCKKIIGYAPRGDKSSYPFATFRSRHLAAADLEHSGIQSGAQANCSTRKTPPSGSDTK